MQAFWTAVTAFFSMFTTLCSAGEKAAATLDNIAGVGQMKSRTYLTEAEHDQEVAVEEFAFAREKRRAELEAKRKALTAPEPKAVATKTKALAAPATATA